MATSSFARRPTTGATATPPKPPAAAAGAPAPRPPARQAAAVPPAPPAKTRTAPGATPAAPARKAPVGGVPAKPATTVAAAPPKVTTRPAVPARRAAPAPPPPPVDPVEDELPPEEEEQPAEEVETEVLPPEEEEQPATPVETRLAAPAPRGRRRPPAAPVAAPKEEALPAIAVPRGAIGAISGAPIDSDDLLLPQLKVAQKVGPLSELNPAVPPGTIVVGAGEQWEYLYADGSYPVGVTFVRTDKCFQQIKNEDGDKLYDLDERAITFTGPDAKEQMIAFGGTCQDVKGMKVFGPMLVCEVLVRMPEGLENEFSMFQPVEGHDGLFVRALWRISASAYIEAGKKLLSEAGGFCANGSHRVEFDMTTKLVPAKNPYYVPVIKNGAVHDEAFVAYIEANA